MTGSRIGNGFDLNPNRVITEVKSVNPYDAEYRRDGRGSKAHDKWLAVNCATVGMTLQQWRETCSLLGEYEGTRGALYATSAGVRKAVMLGDPPPPPPPPVASQAKQTRKRVDSKLATNGDRGKNKLIAESVKPKGK